ncbi:MAG TPA: biotin-dependent carboxyltransferase family protein [Xanthobacteraceae bacterium]|nr:biotin-dependent carboxyltransferase family protein [Xanthobacteraceae bacterium]
MTGVLRVLSPGLLTTVQDLGRPGYQSLGIPVGGALDPVSLRAANALVGNTPDIGALEIAYVGPTLAVDADEVRLSFAGAEALIEILPDEAASAGYRISTMRSVLLHRGEVVRIGSLTGGAVLYVGVEGGLAVEPVLGSVSTYLRGGIGGWQGRALTEGDQLPLRLDTVSERQEWQLEGFDLTPPQRFRTIVGPQSDHFSEATIETFFNSEYTIGTGADRMGMRLLGPLLEHSRGFNITSDGIAPGSIQVPGNGLPIVLLADRQTVGGYTKIATVISADLPALSRLPIGNKLRFAPVKIEEAEAARRKFVADVESLPSRIVPIGRYAGDLAGDLTPRLLDCNLIGGVIDASVGA